MHGPLQTGNCPLTIVLVINDVCKMLHMVTYFLGHLSIILLVLHGFKTYYIKSKKKKKTTTNFVSVKHKGNTSTQRNP